MSHQDKAALALSSTAPKTETTPSGGPNRGPDSFTGHPQFISPQPVSVTRAAIPIRYLDISPIRVKGLVTGNTYDFSMAQPVQAIDARDASPLLNTRLFRRA